MSLLPPRKQRGLGRAGRMTRDDRLVVIATEDRFAPKQYFEALELSRVSVRVFGTEDNRSHASWVVERLREVFEDAKKNNELQPDDEFWVLLDTDHWTQPNHVAGFSQAIQEARQAGFRVAVSNPCFELWLLLHVADVSPPLDACADVESQLRAVLGGYNKTNVPADKLHPGISRAVERAKKLDVGTNGWPQSTGTQVHELVEALLP